MKKTFLLLLVLLFVAGGLAQADVLTVLDDGGDRLVATQYTDGGWGWPLNAPPTYSNIIGPIAMGLAKAYRETGDAGQFTALQNAAAYLQSKPTGYFSPSDGYIAAELDSILGGTANTDFVKANFYDKLASGTYDRLGQGTLYDTAGYVSLVRTARANAGIGNLAAWDIGIGIVGADAVGASTSEWISGTKAEIDELDGSAYYDVIGLAGAVYGLASVDENYDPTAGEHSAAGSLSDLADILAGYQIWNSGGFAWNSNYVIPNDGDESVQETAYSVLALKEMGGYAGEIDRASQWLQSVQLGTGGWEQYSGSGENNEVTGEALWAIQSNPVPEPSTLFLLGGGIAGLFFMRKKN